MSEKRFQPIFDEDLNDSYIKDNLTSEVYFTIPSLAHLLNFLNTHITELYKTVNMLKLQTYCQDQYIKKLELEQKALLEQLETQNI